MTIRYRLIEGFAPVVHEKGDWIDLKSAGTYFLSKPDPAHEIMFDSTLISLGIAIELPKGFEAIIAPRSSLFKNKGVILANSIGVIDNSYSGNDDIWKFHAIALKSTVIERGERLCQFRIQPSQKASTWIKLRWLFVRKITFKQVSSLKSTNRGGIGSTGGYK